MYVCMYDAFSIFCSCINRKNFVCFSFLEIVKSSLQNEKIFLNFISFSEPHLRCTLCLSATYAFEQLHLKLYQSDRPFSSCCGQRVSVVCMCVHASECVFYFLFFGFLFLFFCFVLLLFLMCHVFIVIKIMFYVAFIVAPIVVVVVSWWFISNLWVFTLLRGP